MSCFLIFIDNTNYSNVYTFTVVYHTTSFPVVERHLNTGLVFNWSVTCLLEFENHVLEVQF